MAGRPPLRIGQHGKITRKQIEPNVWIARCRFRDYDGVTRLVERRSPKADQRGKLAEDVLVEALAKRRPPGTSGTITMLTPLADLVSQHLEMIERSASPATMTTYRSAERNLLKYTQSLRVGEATPGRLNAVIVSLQDAHGSNMARHGRTLLRAAMQIAVMDDVLDANPVKEVSRIESDGEVTGAPALDSQQMRDLLTLLRASEMCRKADLTDPIIVLMGTGFRRSELLALRWEDYDDQTGEMTTRGKVVRVSGQGLKRFDTGKTKSSIRTVTLPGFAIAALRDRKANKSDWRGDSKYIFPATNGNLRDPDNFNKQWRKVRDALGVPDVTSHSFRKSVATIIDDNGLSARIGADQLGHRKVSMTQDRYMKRGKTHPIVADLLDQAVSPHSLPSNK
ncbi:site-specific integrase [Mycolicibacterium sp. 018/SC-01/001]|uniref:site-specific integrase n=1 Tax=Mycolicibacterium sp. 018/SC-01/001 TaxID=2592069 RepID=UPI00118118CC|nr:site-specific integrase [Mycolicibacterium sp. 018/SC-01/001]TRW85568.1 site-specific integrase [Mycolicibacterium sp. 018/SC-01/001]